MKRLAELTFVEAERERARGRSLVLVPIGSTEAHGPHLPLGTDLFLSEELARRAAVQLEADGWSTLIAPGLAYAITDYAAGFAGTISLAEETAIQLVAQVLRALIEQGFMRICLINSHLEPAHVSALRAACVVVRERTGVTVAFPDQTERRWARTLTEEYKRGACHAGSYETSLLLAARPELVQDAVRAALAPLPVDLVQAMKAGKKTFVEAGAPQAYFGDPAGATLAEGNAIYALLVQMVVTTVAESWST